MKKLLVVIMIVVLAVSFAFAQEELDTKKMDAGLRLGIMNNFGGITARLAVSEDSKVEVVVSTPGFRGVILTGMYQWHKPIGETQNLSWYFGGGLHMGYWTGASPRWNGTTWVNRDFALGLDAVVGIQYDIENLIDFPLSISLDYKPSYDIISYWSFNLGDVALSLRYSF